MTKKASTTDKGKIDDAPVEQWPGIDSRYRLIVVAAQRSKQLLNGSVSRIETDPRKQRNTSVALEEVKRGLVAFKVNPVSKD